MKAYRANGGRVSGGRQCTSPGGATGIEARATGPYGAMTHQGATAGNPVAATSDARVDIILATHERPHTIGYAIDSVLRQTHGDLQLHVVGDGCAPGT